MANKKFWLGMLVMMLVLGMTVIGCEQDDPYDPPYDDYDNRPSLAGFVSLDNDYPVVGERITASYKKGSYGGDPIGTPSWRWYKTQEDSYSLSNITNKTLIGSSDTYTVRQDDVGYWIWVELSYSGNSGTEKICTSSTVMGIPATATVSVSMTAIYYPSRSYQNYEVTVTLTLSDGRWDDVSYSTASQWLTMSGTPSVSSWYTTGYSTPSVYVEGRELRLIFQYYSTNSDTVLPINLTATLNTAQLSTMRSYTNVYNTLSAGTPATVSVSQWNVF